MDKKMFKIGFLIGIVLIIGVGYYTMKTNIIDNTTKPIILSELDLENENGEKVLLKAGKPIIINFWATWCEPCVAEFPQFEKLKNKYSDKIDFIMISDEEINKIVQFKSKKGYSLKMLRSVKIFNDYGLIGRPATYFYNSKGILIQKLGGGLSEEILENEVELLIENEH